MDEYGDLERRECKKCRFGCRACSFSAASVLHCTACDFGWTLNAGKCENNCAAGQFMDSKTGSCQSCSNGCAKCEGANNCIQCNKDFHKLLKPASQSECLSACPFGTYSNVNFADANSLQCLKCDSRCAGCTGNAGNCLSCAFFTYNLKESKPTQVDFNDRSFL